MWRAQVSYGKGSSLVVKVDGEAVVTLEKLFDRVSPDECSWTLEGEVLVVSMEKQHARPWTDLTLREM